SSLHIICQCQHRLPCHSHVRNALLPLNKIPLSPTSTLFPYTTLFRSPRLPAEGGPLPQEVTGASATVPTAPPGTAERRAHHDRRSEEHTSELQSRFDLVCRLLLEKKKFILLLHNFICSRSLVVSANTC